MKRLQDFRLTNTFCTTIMVAVLLLTGCASNRQTASGSLPGDASKARNDNERYLLTYYPMAVEQMEKHNIPASITLAQALLEGNAGKSTLVKEANNHFGVKADKRWKGKSMSKMDNGRMCKFRVYGSTRESYEDHSRFLLDNRRYDFLFKYKKTDYKKWAKGLRDAGYAEDRAYHTKLIGIIERYGLQKYDHYSMSDIGSDYRRMTMQESSGDRSVHKGNGLLYTVAREGDTFETLSKAFGISKSKLRKYNDLYKGYRINAGDIIYLEKKNSKATKGHDFHTTKEGESLYQISQKYGIRLDKLYKMNPQYESYATLKVGDIIRLR